jgi:hypothetical protein
MSNRKRTHSSGVCCTKCNKELAFASNHALMLKGKPPIEIFALAGSQAVHIVCGACGTLVFLDGDMMVLQ